MVDLGFDGKVAVVTGAGGGLGREHALEFARRGARIVVNDLGGSVDGSGGSKGPAEEVVTEIEALGGEAVADGNSVATEAGGEAIIKSAIDAFGRIDIVVNNAGILRDKTFHNMTDDLVTPVIDVHLKGAFYVTRPAWIHFREQGYGRVINTSSSSGLLGNFGQANYGAAKMGLVGLTRVLAAEGAKYNINVNAIAPGYIATDNTQALRDDKERYAAILERIPAGRWGDPDDFKGAAVFLASDASSYMHGAILTVDGGWMGR